MTSYIILFFDLIVHGKHIKTKGFIHGYPSAATLISYNYLVITIILSYKTIIIWVNRRLDDLENIKQVNNKVVLQLLRKQYFAQ